MIEIRSHVTEMTLEGGDTVRDLYRILVRLPSGAAISSPRAGVLVAEYEY